MEEKNILIQQYKSLIEEDKRNGTSEAVSSLRVMLNKNRGKDFPYSYKDSELEFLNSDYLSDYFKDGIKRMITDEVQIEGKDLLKKLTEERNVLYNTIINSGESATNEEQNRLLKLDKEIQRVKDEGITSVSKELVTILENFVNSNRTTKEMTEEEIKAVFEVRESRIKTDDNIVTCFYSYMFKLDSPNISSYIKNNVEPWEIVRHLLYTSGLYDRKAYSSGVNYSYLNQKHLTLIFNKLYIIDKDYALEFVKMIDKLKVLDPNKFIRTFYALAKNNFKFAIEEKDEEKNKTLSIYGKYKDALSCVRDINNSYYDRDDLDKLLSYSISTKEYFYDEIKTKLKELDHEFAAELDNDTIFWHKELVCDSRKINEITPDSYISKFVSIISGHIVEYQNNQELVFLKSEYLSEYFKDSIRKVLKEEKQNINEETKIILSNFLDSIRRISEMSKEELNALFEFNKYRNKTNENILDYLFIYILSLNYINSSTIIKDTISPRDIASQILEISKHNKKFYPQARTNETKYFESDCLEEIFLALYQLDENYAFEFLELVKNINSLEVNEFSETFYAFAENNFKHFKENNTSIDILQDPATNSIRERFIYRMNFITNGLKMLKVPTKYLK